MSISGFNPYENISEILFTGRFPRSGYSIERIIIESKNEIPLPVLVFVPDGDRTYPAVIYLDQYGKQAETEPGGLIETLVRSGKLVIVPDLPGCGELQYGVPGEHSLHRDDSVVRGVSYNVIFGAQLINKSITGFQAGAIIRTLRYLVSRDDVDPEGIYAISKGITGPALMHAAAFDKTIQKLFLIESPLSWESILAHRLYDPAIGSTIVPSALTCYDLPDLVGIIAPRKVTVINPVDGNAEPAPESIRNGVYQITKPYYYEHEGNFEIIDMNDSNSLNTLLSKGYR
jgi:hypothetical protein